jgi:hypothetical protein
MGHRETSTGRLGGALAYRGHAGRVLSAGLIVAAAVLLAAAAIAQAGEYHVYSCSDPVTGATLPVYGWKASGNGPTSNTCATNPVAGGLKTEAWAQFGGTRGTWTFTAPADTHIVTATVYRSALVGYRALAYWAAPEDEYTSSDAFDSCQGPGQSSPCTLGNATAQSCQPVSCYSPSDVLNVPAANLPSPALSLSMRCLTGGCGGWEVLHSADLTLQQDFPPTGSATGGSLTSQPVLQGIQDINISASDPGSGVFQAIFQVDGKALAWQTIDTNGGSCKPYETAPDGTSVFLDPLPCPQSVTNVDVPFNTAQAPDGSHQLTVLVSDAAGNTTPILSRTVAFNNSGEYTLQVQRQQQAERQAQELMTRGVCNAGCDDHASLQAARAKLTQRVFTRRYADSALTLAGRLLDHAGGPIAGAEIELRQQPSYLGADSRLIATTKTDQSGNWRFRVRNGPSRVLTVGYRSHSKDPGYAAQLSYHEKVLAPVTLSAPRQARPGRRFDFRGRLAGGYLSPGGVLVSLEIYYGGTWREIALLRTSRRGTFSYRYTFAAVEPATYYFRAVIPSAVVYPFASAASRPTPIQLLKG